MEKNEYLNTGESALSVAHRVIAECDFERGDLISNLKLQKMLYYLQGFFIAVFDKKLFDDPIVAWQYGPVVVSVYENFKKFEDRIIRLKGNEKMVNLNKLETKLFGDVMKEYGQFSAIKLLEMTHEEPPWNKAFNKGPGTEITYENLKEYFKTQIE